MKIKRKGDIWQIGGKYEKWYYKLPFEFGSLKEAQSFTEQYGLKESYDFNDILETILSKAVTKAAKRLKLYDYEREQEKWSNLQSDTDHGRDEFRFEEQYEAIVKVYDAFQYYHRDIHMVSLNFCDGRLDVYLKAFSTDDDGNISDNNLDYPFGEGTFNVLNCTWDMWGN